MSRPTDRELLRRFEPVLRFTQGERFFPMDVDRYVRECSLWVHRPDRLPQCLVPEGELTLERLAEPRVEVFDAVQYLRFIEPLNIPELAAYEVERLRRDLAGERKSQKFYAGMGRLARVGYLSRFLDALFSLTLLARGRVPGDTATAARIAYRRLQESQPRYQYYARVARQDHWCVLQYYFFYAFNDWRSGFSGVNDHEADWEMVLLYLSERESGAVRPEWVAYASHDYAGDDLRRHWSDPELEREGEHPIVYVGAGSHASYFSKGEYLGELELPFLKPFTRLNKVLRVRLGRALQEVYEDEARPDLESLDPLSLLRVPFVDYARGDGLSIGPRAALPWEEPGLLDPIPDWALHYRGLWGLYARDPIAGENAPAGPLYERNGTLRRAWYDPVGWAGLDKMLPAPLLVPRIQEQRATLHEVQVARAAVIADKQTQLVGLGMQIEALRGKSHLKAEYVKRSGELTALSEELSALRAADATDATVASTLEQYAKRLAAGGRWPRRAHIRRAHHPISEADLRMGRVAELWAALSIGITLLAFVGLLVFARQHALLGLGALLFLFIFIEAGFRRWLERLIGSLAGALAIVAVLVLLFEFFWEVVVLSVLAAGVYLLFQNVQEMLDRH